MPSIADYSDSQVLSDLLEKPAGVEPLELCFISSHTKTRAVPIPHSPPGTGAYVELLVCTAFPRPHCLPFSFFAFTSSTLASHCRLLSSSGVEPVRTPPKMALQSR